MPIGKTARKIARIVSKNLPVEPVVEEGVKAVRQRKGNGKMGNGEIEQTVIVAMKQAVRDSVKEATRTVAKGRVEETAKPRKRG